MNSPWDVVKEAIATLEHANQQAKSQGQEQVAPPGLLRDLEWVQKWTWISEGGHWMSGHRRDSDFAWGKPMNAYSVLHGGEVVGHDDSMEGYQWAAKQDRKDRTR